MSKSHCGKFFDWAESFGDYNSSTLAKRVCGRGLLPRRAWEPSTGDRAWHAGTPSLGSTSAKALQEFEWLERLLLEAEMEND